MSTFIEQTSIGSAGATVAVKDVIDVAGLPTTAGCRAIADRAQPALADAACLGGLRAAVAAGEARIVGKANLDELAASAHGANPWFGTPRNPRDPTRICGGSSSGSAVAVASGDAEIAIGTDTGGSVRIPAACCGVTGLKTTWGRIPTAGVVPYSQSFDTVGPLARDVAGVVRGMELLEPGFALGIGLPEGLRNHGAMVEREPEKVGPVAETIRLGRDYLPREVEARRAARGWAAELAAACERVELLAMPTLVAEPLPLERGEEILSIACTLQLNGAGLPALAQPIGAAGPLPPSLQLFGPPGCEELLLATGAVVEAAAGAVVD